MAAVLLGFAPAPRAGTIADEYPAFYYSDKPPVEEAAIEEDLVVEWRPSRQHIRDLEKRLRMPPGASRLHRYERFYYGIVVDDRRLVMGTLFLVDRKTKFTRSHVVSYSDRGPIFHDGGCFIVELRFDVDTRELDIGCHGEA